MSSDFCQVWLTCGDTVEADTIAKALLGKRLVACVKQMPVSSDFHWQGKIEHGNEALLIMDTKLDLFEQIEPEVKKLHSYDTYVLQAIPIAQLSKDAEDWLIESTDEVE